MYVTVDKRLEELEKRVRRVEKEIKNIKEVLELAPVVNPLRWDIFTDLEKAIIQYLLDKKFEGATTTEMARKLNLPSPEGSGRVIVWRRLRRIQRLSKRKKGVPIVVYESKRWFMNYEEFSFA
jgi:hypothetical protein